MNVDRGTVIFMLKAIETLSIAVQTGKYDESELYEIHMEAGVHLFDVLKTEEA